MSGNDDEYYDDLEYNNNKTKDKGLGFIGIGIFVFFIMIFVFILLGSSDDNVSNENNSLNNNKENINENNNQNDISIENNVNKIIEGIGENKDKENHQNVTAFADGTYQNITIENFTFSMPNYWSERGQYEGSVQYCAGINGQEAELSIEYKKETDENYDVSYNGLETDNDNMIKGIELMYDKVNNYETFESDFGVKGIVYDFTFSFKEFIIIR